MSMFVAFCCNDERGSLTRYATAVHLPAGMLDLEAQTMRGLSFREVRPDRIRICRREFDVHGYRPMYGNVFWNGYALKARDVIKLLVRLKESGKFACEGGWEELCDWWDKPNGYDDAGWLLMKFREAFDIRPASAAVDPNEDSNTGKPTTREREALSAVPGASPTSREEKQ